MLLVFGLAGLTTGDHVPNAEDHLTAHAAAHAAGHVAGHGLGHAAAAEHTTTNPPLPFKVGMVIKSDARKFMTNRPTKHSTDGHEGS